MNFRLAIPVLFAPLAVGAQSPSAPATRTVAAYPAQHAIIIDGRLDEAEWRDAAPATGFVHGVIVKYTQMFSL